MTELMATSATLCLSAIECIDRCHWNLFSTYAIIIISTRMLADKIELAPCMLSDDASSVSI